MLGDGAALRGRRWCDPRLQYAPVQGRVMYLGSTHLSKRRPPLQNALGQGRPLLVIPGWWADWPAKSHLGHGHRATRSGATAAPTRGGDSSATGPRSGKVEVRAAHHRGGTGLAGDAPPLTRGRTLAAPSKGVWRAAKGHGARVAGSTRSRSSTGGGAQALRQLVGVATSSGRRFPTLGRNVAGGTCGATT